MASLIQYVTSEAQIRGVGVFIREIPPPGVVTAPALNVVGFVGEFPWGPINTPIEPMSAEELLNTFFGPCGQGHPAYQAFVGKRFGRVICSRVGGGVGHVAASVTIKDAATGGSAALVATARFPGAAGNNIQIEVIEEQALPAIHGVEVSFTQANGAEYRAYYPAVQVANGDVTDPGDPYVAFAKASGASSPAWPGTYMLGQVVADPVSARVVGSDGTPTTSTYGLAFDSILGASSPASIVTVVEKSSSLSHVSIATVMHTKSADYPEKLFITPTVPAETPSEALQEAANIRRDNVIKLWPRVRQNLSDSNGDLVNTLVDGAPFLSSILANTDPWLSPGGPAVSAPFTSGINSLDPLALTASNATYANLVEGGVSPWFMSSRFGAILRGAVSTSLDTAINRIRRRRYTTYLAEAMSSALEPYVDSPLDIDLARQRLGPNTSAQIGMLTAFLEEEQSNARLIAYSISPYEAMTPAKYAQGRWDIVIRVQDVPGAEQIVLRLQSGPSVVV
jgi:hypothetical protein